MSALRPGLATPSGSTYGHVGREGGGHGALGASGARGAGGGELDGIRVWLIGKRIASHTGSVQDGGGGGKSREEESEGTHLGCLWRVLVKIHGERLAAMAALGGLDGLEAPGCWWKESRLHRGDSGIYNQLESVNLLAIIAVCSRSRERSRRFSAMRGKERPQEVRLGVLWPGVANMISRLLCSRPALSQTSGRSLSRQATEEVGLLAIIGGH